MSNLKMCTILTAGGGNIDSFRLEFDNYPQGMPFPIFREVIQRHTPIAKKGGSCFGVGMSHVWAASQQRSAECRKSHSDFQPTAPQLAEPLQQSINAVPTATTNGSDAHVARHTEGNIPVYVNSKMECTNSSVLSRSAENTSFSSWRCTEWNDNDNVETFFNKIDTDSDGLVTWDDVLQLAVEEATQSITVMAEELRSYSFSRQSPRMKLIHSVHPLMHHKSLFAVVTRGAPLTLLSKKDMSVVKTFNQEEYAYAPPEIVQYLPLPDILLAYSRIDKKVCGWWSVVSNNRMGTLQPLSSDDTFRQIRLRPKIFPHSFFTGGSHGVVSHWQVPKQRSVLEMTPVNNYDALHSRDSGGLTDFILTDEWLLSTGFDRRLLSTNLETSRSILIGRPRDTIRLVEYNRSYACLPSVSYTNQLLLWDVRSSTVTPSATFRDDSVKPHTVEVNGLCNAKGLPQVITSDVSGLVKVWDLRTLRCVQSIYADGSISEDLGGDRSHCLKRSQNGEESLAYHPAKAGETRSIRSICYIGSTQEIVSASSEMIHCIRYNHRRDGTRADMDPTCNAAFDLRQGTIILQGSTRVSVWDTAEGFRKRLFDRTTESGIPYWQQEILAMCLDQARSRILLAIADGMVEVRSSKGFEFIESFQMHDAPIREMLYSTKHKLLISISINGTLAVRHDSDIGTYIITVNLSNIPPRALTFSDELGLIGCCDERQLYLVDVKQSKLRPIVLNTTSPIRSMTLFGSYPLLATGCENGELILWSTPPAEESFVQLVSLLITNSPCGSPVTQPSRDKKGYRGDRSTLCTFSSCTVSIKEKTRNSTNRSESLISSHRKRHTKSGNNKEKIIEELLHAITMDERTEKEISFIACDEITHRLFVADKKGNVFIFSLCAFLREYGFQKCSFERRTRYQLMEQTREFGASIIVVVRQINLHKAPVTYMTWFPSISVLISCDEDRLVKLLDYNGTEKGQLVMDRLPPKSVNDAVDVSSVDQHTKVIQKFESLPYALPTPFPHSAACPDCSRRRTIARPLIKHPLGEDLWSNSRHVSLNEYPPGETLDQSNSEMLPTLENRRGHSAGTTRTEAGTQEGGKTSVTFAQSSCGEVTCPPVDSNTIPFQRRSKKRGTNEDSEEPLETISPSSRLVALEEKRQWRPQKEKECQFTYRVDKTPRLVHTSDFFETRSAQMIVADVCRARAGSDLLTNDIYSDAKGWWKPDLGIPTTMASRKGYSCKIPLIDIASDKKEEIGSSLGRDALSVTGITLTAMSSTQIPSRGLSSSRERSPQIIRMPPRLAKKKIVLDNNNVEEEAQRNSSTSFLDNMVRAYDKELHRCVRGKGGMERLCGRPGIAVSEAKLAQTDAFFSLNKSPK